MKNLINKLKSNTKHILVIGDIILDRYMFGSVDHVSPEAPVPVVNFSRETSVLGGAANVANNLATLDVLVELVGVVGADSASEEIAEHCANKSIWDKGVIEDDMRPTTVKTRVVANHQQIVRIDRESRASIPVKILKKIERHINSISPKGLGAIVISDYCKGVVTEKFMDFVREISSEYNIPVIVDPKNPMFNIYRNFTVLLPNTKEASMGAGLQIIDDKTLTKAGNTILSKLNLSAVLVTRGEEGMTLFEKNKEVNIPTMAKKVCDVTGAGDTVTAVMALGLSVGMSVYDAARIANYAAGIVIEKFGTSTVSLSEMIEKQHET